MISQSHWSFTVLGNKPKKFDFVHQTVSRREACAGWARDYTRPSFRFSGRGLGTRLTRHMILCPPLHACALWITAQVEWRLGWDVVGRFSSATRGKWLQLRSLIINKNVWQRPIGICYPAEEISLKQTNSEVENSCHKGKVSASCMHIISERSCVQWRKLWDFSEFCLPSSQKLVEGRDLPNGMTITFAGQC